MNTGDTRSRDNLAQLALVVIVLALVAWPILAGELGQKAYDHRTFHLPLVREWAATWPIVNLRDYNSATGPLYHWLMAGVAQLTGTGGGTETSPPLQFASSLFGALVVVVAYRFARTCLPLASAFLAALALAFSPYLLGNAIWMMTDNLALALVAITVGFASFMPWTKPRTLGQGIVAALAVATRQINLWLIAPIVMSALLRSRRSRAEFVVTAVSALLVVAALATFVALWGGVVPPSFRDRHTGGLQPAAIGFALTLVAAYGVCLVPAMLPSLKALVASPALLAMVLLAGALLGMLGESFASLDAGRNGGWLWRAVAHFPVVAGRSTFLVGCSAIGAVVIAALLIDATRALRGSQALVVLTAFVGFLAAHVANAQVYQRYYDPMVLITLVWLVALSAPRGESLRARTVALGLLSVQQACFAIVVLYLPLTSAS